MKIKKVNELNEIKMFDNPSELLEHVENLINDVPHDIRKLNNRFNNIVKDNPNELIVIELEKLISVVNSKVKIFKDFIEDIKIFRKEMDIEYKENPTIDDQEGDDLYDELDDAKNNIESSIDKFINYKTLLNTYIKLLLKSDDIKNRINRY